MEYVPAMGLLRHVDATSRKRLILLASILGSTIVFLDGSIVNVALPAIRRDLGGGLELQEWVVDAYLLTLGSLILVGGSLSDLFGGKRVFELGVATFGLTSVICAIAPNGPTLIVARGLQGIAGALLTPAALATITTVFSGEERGAAIGTWTAWTGIAFIIGPVVGGQFVESVSWRSIFLINVPIVIVTLALLQMSMPPSRTREGARVDVIGGILCVLGLGGPVFALIEAPTRGFGDPLIVACIVGGLALLGAFVVWELHEDSPMLPLRLFRLRNFTFANIETLTVYAALSTLTFFLVIFLQQVAGYSPRNSGLATVPISLVMFFLSPRVARLSMRVGPRYFMGIGPLICAASILWIRELSPGFDYWTALLPPLLVFAVGLSMIVAPLTSTVLADAGEHDAGIASGVNNAVARVAGLVGIAVVGAAIAGSQNRLDLGGYRLSMAITAGLIAAGGVIGLVGIRNRAA
jgi:EmrB/QacA subfamily drug resistance transporter